MLALLLQTSNFHSNCFSHRISKHSYKTADQESLILSRGQIATEISNSITGASKLRAKVSSPDYFDTENKQTNKEIPFSRLDSKTSFILFYRMKSDNV